VTARSASRSGSQGRLRPARRFAAPALAIVVLVTVALTAFAFHDRAGWLPDDGVYAYGAWMLTEGQVLHRDIQEIHAGYVTLLHAALFRLQGVDILHLRLPLIAITLGQSALIYAVLRRAVPLDGLVPALGALAAGMFSFVLFVNPSASWYALGLAAVAVWSLAQPGRATPARFLGIGFLVGAAFMFRQLSGIWLAMGALSCILIERSRPDAPRGLLAPALFAAMGAALLWYLLHKQSLTGFLMIGIWPLLLLAIAGGQSRIADREMGPTIGYLGLGALLAALPALIYNGWNAVWSDWFEDTVLVGLHLSGLDFVQNASYLTWAAGGLHSIGSGEPIAVANGLYFVLLLAAPPILGALSIKRAVREKLHPLPVIAMFFSLSALHFQVPAYLYFSVGLTLAAGLLMFAGTRLRQPVFAVIAFLCAAATLWHAGEPLARPLAATLRGERMPMIEAVLPRMGVRLTIDEAKLYRDLLGAIETTAEPQDLLAPIPVNPELNLMSGRKSPFRFVNGAIGTHDAARLAEAAAALGHPGIIVVHRRDDKYNAGSQALLAIVRARYEVVASVSGFDIYRPRF
jgi:hypothetical protein